MGRRGEGGKITTTTTTTTEGKFPERTKRDPDQVTAIVVHIAEKFKLGLMKLDLLVIIPFRMCKNKMTLENVYICFHASR